MNDDLRWIDQVTDSGFFGTEGGDGAEALDSAVIDLVDELMARAAPGRGGLIRVLLALQEKFDRVSWRVQELVADRFDLSPAQVAGVVSYFPLLSAERRGRLKIVACTGSGCSLRGGERVFDQLGGRAADLALKVDDPPLAVRQERCLGVCGLGPVIRTPMGIRKITGAADADATFESVLAAEPDGEVDP